MDKFKTINTLMRNYVYYTMIGDRFKYTVDCYDGVFKVTFDNPQKARDFVLTCCCDLKIENVVLKEAAGCDETTYYHLEMEWLQMLFYYIELLPKRERTASLARYCLGLRAAEIMKIPHCINFYKDCHRAIQTLTTLIPDAYLTAAKVAI